MTHDEMDARALEEFAREDSRLAREDGYRLRTDRPEWANLAGLALQALVVEHQALRRGALAGESVEIFGIFRHGSRPLRSNRYDHESDTVPTDPTPSIDVPVYAAATILRVLALPGGVRIAVRRNALLDVLPQDLIDHWSRQRPWRVRRGIQVLRAAVHWMHGLTR